MGTHDLVSEQLTTVYAPTSSAALPFVVHTGKDGIVPDDAAEEAIAATEDHVLSKFMTVDEKIVASMKANDPDKRHSDKVWLQSHPSFVPLTAKQVKQFYQQASSSSHPLPRVESGEKGSTKVSIGTHSSAQTNDEMKLPHKNVHIDIKSNQLKEKGIIED